MKLNLLFINDVHGYLAPHAELFYDETGETIETAGGYAHIAGIVETIRKENPNTLLFDGGDTLHGTKPIVDTKGEALVPILNALKPDALVGHWDFGYGPQQLQKLNKQLSFPILGCNVYNEEDENFLQPTQLFKLGDVTIGVVGVCAMIVDKVMPEKFSKGLRFTSGMNELPHYISQLKKQGADLIILLSHNGFPQDVKLLETIEDVDICLSAHTHNRLYEPIEVNGTRIVQCGCHGAFVGNFTLSVEQGQIKTCDYELIKVDSASPKQPEMDQLVQETLKPYAAINSEVLGQTTAPLHRYASINSTMDNLLLRAIAQATKTDIAFSNGWRYGAPIPVGKITENDLYNITPMNPPVSTVELTGREIKLMLEENLERTFSCDPLKQMGGYVKRVLGLQINMRIENPNGHRIQEIFYKGAPLEKNKTYKVSFVTMQGVAKTYGKNRQESPIKAVAAMKAYLKAHPVFTPDILKRYYLV